MAALVTLAAMGLARTTFAYPEPSIAPTSWLLDIKYDHPRTIAVRLPGEAGPTFYWYMTYTVTNNTGEDQNFVPEITLLSDSGDLVRANRSIPPRVFTTIKNELKNPLLKSPTELVGRLLQGPNNAVDGIAIWPMAEHDVDEIAIFVQGLSGEAYEVKEPGSDEVHLLRRTLMITYHTPGSIERQPQKPWLFRDQVWVVR